MARGNAAHKEAAFLRLIRATQQISVRQGGVLLDRLAAHPHTRVQRHTHANSKGDMHTHTHTHIHTTLNTFTPRHNYTQFRPESKRHIKEKSTSLSRCALMLKLKVDQKSGRWKRKKERKKEKKKERRKRRKKKIIMRSVFLTKIGLSIYIFSRAVRTTNDERPSHASCPPPSSLVPPSPPQRKDPRFSRL